MKFSEIGSRITGFSTPVFGISWNPSEDQRKVARETIIFLEAKRVLYNPSELECPDHCIISVLDIRDFLTSQLPRVKPKSELEGYLRAMRTACNKFLDKGDPNESYHLHIGMRGSFSDWEFIYALGDLRGVFASMISQISSAYGIDVEDELASILPLEKIPSII